MKLKPQTRRSVSTIQTPRAIMASLKRGMRRLHTIEMLETLKDIHACALNATNVKNVTRMIDRRMAALEREIKKNKW